MALGLLVNTNNEVLHDLSDSLIHLLSEHEFTLTVLKIQATSKTALTTRSLTGKADTSSNEEWLVGQVCQSHGQGAVGAWKMDPWVE